MLLEAEFHEGVARHDVEATFGKAVFSPTTALISDDAVGVIKAWPLGDGGLKDVVLHAEWTRQDTQEIAWFGAGCGRYSNANAVRDEFVAGAADREPGEIKASNGSAYDVPIEIQSGIWWHPPLLASMKLVVWRAPLRLLRLIPETGHYCVCEIADRRLTEAGYFRALPDCVRFLETWID